MQEDIVLYSEEDAQNKVMIPLLEKLGYKKEEMEFQKPIKVSIGRKTKVIYPDIVVCVDGTPAIVVEMKKPGVRLDDIVVEQAISYARLLDDPAQYAIVSNGYETHIYDVIKKERRPEIPSAKECAKSFSKLILQSHITNEIRAEAKKIAFAIDSVSEFANILSRCHDYLRTHDGLDPTAAFDEISKILFIKMIEEIDAEEKKRESRFSVKQIEASGGYDFINSILFKNTKKRFENLFDESEKINLSSNTIKEIVKILEPVSLQKTDIDIKGVAYETFLSKTFRGEGLGQYFTPREIVNFMTDLVNPHIDAKVLDPACGSGGFLKSVFRKIKNDIMSGNNSSEEKKRLIKRLSTKQLFGTDINPRLAQTCKMNMIVHGDGNTGIFRHDGLLNVPGKIDDTLPKEQLFDVILTNPPFGSVIRDGNIIKKFDFGLSNGVPRKSVKSEILFLERCLNLLKPGGELAIIIPDGILQNSSYGYIREKIRERAIIKAIISLPQHAFLPCGANVKTSILYLKKKTYKEEEQPDIFMAIAEQVGYDASGKSIKQNDLPFIKNQFYNLKGDDAENFI